MHTRAKPHAQSAENEEAPDGYGSRHKGLTSSWSRDQATKIVGRRQGRKDDTATSRAVFFVVVFVDLFCLASTSNLPTLLTAY